MRRDDRPPARPDGWASRRALSRLVARFREGWATTPAPSRRRWITTVALGYPAVLALTAALTEVGRRLNGNGHFAWEADFLVRLDQALPLSFSTAVWLQTPGSDITLALITGGTAAALAWARRPLPALAVLLAPVALDVAVRLAWLFWDRARPTVILDGIAAPGFASFPSGHTAKSTAVFGLLAYLWARATSRWAERLLAAALTAGAIALVAIGRLRMGVHWPSDIVAGLILGGAWVAVLGLALQPGTGEAG